MTKMDLELADLREQNPWWEALEKIEDDSKIRDYEQASIRWNPRLKNDFDLDQDYIYTLRGPRQVGKTTLVKLMIRDLLQNQAPNRIFYYSCDILNSLQELRQVVETYLDWVRDQTNQRVYIFLDEISSVKDWQSAIKFLKDRGDLEKVTLLLTGSSSRDIKQSGEMLPGRRGKGDVNKILMPLKFSDYLKATEPGSNLSDFEPDRQIVFDLFEGTIHDQVQQLRPEVNQLNKKLDSFLLSGGFPPAVNSYFENQEIDHHLYDLYTSVVLGDIFKQEKREEFLRDLVARLIETQTSRVGWNTLKKNTGIRHHETVKEYITSLKESFLVSLFYKVQIEKKTPRTSAHKKIYFSDPFIFHCLRSWIHSYTNPFQASKKSMENKEAKSKLIEAVVGNHLLRFSYQFSSQPYFSQGSSVFYWSNGKEVDFVLKYNDKLWPIEVGFRSKIKDKGTWISKRFGKSLILSQTQFKVGNDYVILPVSIFLTLI